MKDIEVRIRNDEELRERLGEEGFRIVRQKGTERAFTGRYWNSKTPGLYRCSVCSNPLFASDTKYDSGSGWPSYWQPVATACCARKCCVPIARRIWATCFPMGQRPPACATASIRRRWSWMLIFDAPVRLSIAA